MQLLNRNTSTLAVALLLFAVVTAQAQTKIKFDKKSTPPATPLFALEDLRPGMKGTARTVFAGSEPEEFGIEILGVLNGFAGPRQSTIIAKLSGENVARTSVFAGLFVSSDFVANQLVGAFANIYPIFKV